jgi:hypothetical protein
MTKEKFEDVELGDRVADKISGFKGIAVGLTEWMYGCRRITIQPEETKDGSPVECAVFDEPQLKILARGVVEVQDTDELLTKVNHGDRVRDRISKLTGIVVGITLWIHGPRRITIQPEELKDGLPIENVNFDEPLLDILKHNVLTTPRAAAARAAGSAMDSLQPPPHGPRENVTRRADVKRGR